MWKVSTTGARRLKKGTAQEGSQDAETSKSSTSAFSVFGGANLSITNTESSKVITLIFHIFNIGYLVILAMQSKMCDL